MFSSPQEPQPSSSSSPSLFPPSSAASNITPASQSAQRQQQFQHGAETSLAASAAPAQVSRDFSSNHSMKSASGSSGVATQRSEGVSNVPHASAEFGKVPKDAEVFGTVPQSSEAFGNVPNPSATFGNVPHDAETFRRVPIDSEPTDERPATHSAQIDPHPRSSMPLHNRTEHLRNSRNENHTLTVREVAWMFEAAGVARTERSIINWCQPNRTGVARLDAYYEPNERRYFITRQSVEAAIQEEIAKGAKGNETPPSAANAFGTVPNSSGENSNRAKEGMERKTPRAESTSSFDPRSPEEESRVRELEREVIDLKIANRGKDMFIDHLQKQNAAFNDERQSYVTKLIGFSRKVGALTSRLVQLGGPEAAALAEAGQDLEWEIEQRVGSEQPHFERQSRAGSDWRDAA